LNWNEIDDDGVKALITQKISHSLISKKQQQQQQQQQQNATQLRVHSIEFLFN
jgi:transcription initiation factor TFIID subunit TAF12